MPLKSKKQMRWMFANKPEMAKRWADHTPDIKSLPESVGSEKKSEELSMPQTLEMKTVDTIQCLGYALDKGHQFYQEKKAEAQAVAQEIPATVEALLAGGLIEAHEKDAAAVALQSPLTSLELLRRASEVLQKNAASKKGDAPALGSPSDRQGRPVNGPTKTASVEDGMPKWHGGRRTTEKKASDLAYERGLGLAS